MIFFWSNSNMVELFKIFRKFSSAQCFKLCSCKEDHKMDMLKKFEQFITISLAVVLLWMLLTCSYSNAQGSTNFSCVQFNVHCYPNWRSNERCGQTAPDKMLKFLERVKLEVASINGNLKTALVWKPAQNLEKRPYAQFWPKMSIFKKTQYPIFMHLSKEYFLTSFECI